MMYFEELFQPFTVKRPQMVKNNHNDWVEDFKDHLNGSGYIRLLSGSEQLTSRKHTFISTHRLYTSTIDIEKGDMIIQNGITFAVTYSNPLIDNIMQVDLELIE